MLKGQPALDDSGTGLSGESSEVPWEPEWGLRIWLGDRGGVFGGPDPRCATWGQRRNSDEVQTEILANTALHNPYF